MDIILYLINTIKTLYDQNRFLILFICKYIPLKQWAFDDSHSPKYQKFKTDELPKVQYFHHDWDWKALIECYQKHYGKTVRPINRRKPCDIPEDCSCPSCNAPQPYLYRNNGSRGQLMCSVCGVTFHPTQNRFSKQLVLRCPYCSHSLVKKKERKHFAIHKCVNPKCPYYLRNLKGVSKEDLADGNGKTKYKLHYIYREFCVGFFSMDLNSLPKNASSLRFTKHSSYIMGLCLTFHVNLGLSLRKTSQALKDLYDIDISHQMVANYCRTAAMVIKPFTDEYDYHASNQMAADETYFKVRGRKGFLWIIMDTISRSILGYRVSDNRGVGPCIQTMRMAFRHFKKIPEGFKFIADGYSAYPLAAQQFFREYGEKFLFNITQVIGLTNDDEVSAKHRPYKQKIERLNRTFKASYRCTCGFDNFEGANYAVALWVTYYNFLRPHAAKAHSVLNKVPELEACNTMPDKWQMLISLGQQKIIELTEQSSA